MKPFEPMRIDQVFNNPDSYGVGKPHEGLDMSLKGTWGNQDCGTPIKCIYPGKVVHSFDGTKNYGNMTVIESNTPDGKRWHMYCHLDERTITLGLVRRVSGLVKRGEIVGTMGSSGNSSHCHLHLQVWKKKPSSWRRYFKNVLEWYEDPHLLMEADIIVNTEMIISDNDDKIDFKGFKTEEETYGILTLQTTKAKLLAKDTLISSHNSLKKAFKKATNTILDMGEEINQKDAAIKALTENKLGRFARLGRAIDQVLKLRADDKREKS